MQHLYYEPLENTCITGNPIFTGEYTATDAAVVCSNLGQTAPPAGDTWCNPELTNPPQFCPGLHGGPRTPCPKCGTSRCQCPGDSSDANGDASETCAGFWFDKTTESETKKVYFYAEFNPVANGQQCNKGLKSNASLGASTPPVPIAIQLAYHVKPGWMVVPGSADTALSGPYDYTGAADTCMENGDACESFSFECSNAPNGCGICAGGPRDQCEEKFPQEATQITYTHFGQSSLVKDANHAAYWKTGRRFVVPNPPSQKSNVTSVMV
jgi:hypothetical protein